METSTKYSSLSGAKTIASFAVVALLFFIPSEIHDLGEPNFPITKEASFLVVGDIMLGRNVELLSRENPNYPFEKVRKFLGSYETVIGNLEGPIPETHTRTLSGSFSFSFPQNTAEILRANNVEFVSLANNHGLDQGHAGLLKTQEILSQFGITPVGHPSNISQTSATTTRIGNMEISIFAFNETWETFELAEAVNIVRQMRDADYKIILIHWGDEYQPTSNNEQKEIAHALIDAGADVIFGAHPHVIQEIENYKGKIIFYSLGNFIFDQYFSSETQKGLIVQADISEDEAIYTIWPTTSTKSQPILMEKIERELFLTNLASQSGELYNDVAEGILVTPLNK